MIGGVVLLLIVVGLIGSRGGATGTSAAATGSKATTAAATSSPQPMSIIQADPPVATVPPAAPGPAKPITARQWALIAKNPDAHIGERVVVYGQVVQFDTVTGNNGFRANVDGVEHKPSYGFADYKTNTILRCADANILNDLVEGDLFRAEVTVAGAQSYQTTMGGTLTAPQLTVTQIKSIGHV